MRLRVRLFGQDAQLAGQGHVQLDLPGETITCAQIRSALAGAVPCLSGAMKHGRLAVNHAFGQDDQAVTAHDEVALIGMVSGG
jgi:molybdopterin converting factor small subunit